MYVHLANASTVFLCYMSCIVCCYCFYVGKKLYTAYVCNVTLETRLKIKFSILFYSFSDNTRVRTFIFFPEFNIRLYDKNSESDYYFFPPPKSEYFFQQHWESEYFFRKKP